MSPETHENVPPGKDDRPGTFRVRLSEQALSELDGAAERNGRSRSAEVAARIERSLASESGYPEQAALLDLIATVTAQASALIDIMGLEGRASNLALVKAALVDLLDELGAVDDPTAIAMGKGYGKLIIEEARRAAAKSPSRRTPREETLAQALMAWEEKLAGDPE
jgi:uncharacterized membrane protein